MPRAESHQQIYNKQANICRHLYSNYQQGGGPGGHLAPGRTPWWTPRQFHLHQFPILRKGCCQLRPNFLKAIGPSSWHPACTCLFLTILFLAFVRAFFVLETRISPTPAIIIDQESQIQLLAAQVDLLQLK